MDERTLQMRLGLGASAAALFFVLVAIPNWVAAPANVPNIVLSPLFWPYVLACLTGITGLGLIATALRMPGAGGPLNDASEDLGAAIMRLVGIAIIMIALMYLVGSLGLVWTSMLAFLATAALVKSRHPKTAVICAVVVPLILYAFFAHVAGVAIPQGHFVRLP